VKRGHPNKVDEAFMSRCNSFGMSPFGNEQRVNLRTVSARTRERLAKKVEEKHGFALQRSEEEVEKLMTQVEEVQYGAMLDKEAVVMRAQKQRKKDKDLLLKADEERKKISGLLALAEVANKDLDRHLRVERSEMAKGEDKIQSVKDKVVQLGGLLKLKCDEANTLGESMGLLAKEARVGDARLTSLQGLYETKCKELHDEKKKFDNWKWFEQKKYKKLESAMAKLKQERDGLTNVRACRTNVASSVPLCSLFFLRPFCPTPEPKGGEKRPQKNKEHNRYES
jgi:hypothetical protein